MLVLVRLHAVLLPLLSSLHIGHCHFQCPLECVGSFVVPTDRGVRVIGGPAAKKLGKIINDLSKVSSSLPDDEITIDGKKIPVPSKVRSQVRSVLDTFPELSPVFLDILRNRRPTSSPYGKEQLPSFNSQEETLKPEDSQEKLSGPDTFMPRLPDKFRPSAHGPYKKPSDRDVFRPFAPGQRAPKNRGQTPGSPDSFLPNTPDIETFRPSNDQPDGQPEGSLDSEPTGPKRSKTPSFRQAGAPIPSGGDSSEPQGFEPTSPHAKSPHSKETNPFLNEPSKPSSPDTSGQLSPENSIPSNIQNDLPFSPKKFKPNGFSEPEESIPGNNKPFGTSESEGPSSPASFDADGSSEPFSSGNPSPAIFRPNVFPSHPSKTPHSEFPRPSGFNPTRQSGNQPSSPTSKFSSPEANEGIPEVNLPGIVNVPSKDRRTPEDVHSYLKFLEDNPSLFVPIYKKLVNKGVTFPDLRRPVDHVTVKGKRVNLPRPITAAFPVRINGKTFTLPREADKLANFVSQHPEQLPAITTAIRQLGGTLGPDNTGRISSFKLFNKKIGLPQPVTPKIFVNGRPFTLPQDMGELVKEIGHRPRLFHKILPILETFGARPQKSPSGEIKSLDFRGKRFPVRSVAPVPVVIRGRRYNIPADLERILEQPDNHVVGELISALQRSKVPIVVDNNTGNVVGIEREGVRIPFPVAVRLAIKMGGRNFLIPRDLPSIVTQLEQQGVPTDLHVLYNNYGILPVRDRDNQVVAIEFNGKRYPIKTQPKTSIQVGGHRLTLPSDNNRLIRLIQERKVPLDQLLRTIQNAGYRLVPGPDGMLQTAHKGYDVMELPMRIRMLMTINGVKYRIPGDIPRIAELLRTVRNEAAVMKILDSLKLFGVDVRKAPGQVTLSFNGKKHSFPLNPDRTIQRPGTGGAPGSEVSVKFNDRWYRLPKDAKDLVAAIRAVGPGAIALLVKTLQSNGIKVNLTPGGDDIVSFVMDGRVIPVYNDGGDIPHQKKTPPAHAKSSAESSSDRFPVTIRGRQFIVPEDISRLSSLLPNFQYGELITALHKAGHTLEVDDKGMFYGMRVHGGRLVRFPIKFSVSVFADRKGRPFRVPSELEKLAQVLPSHRWNWSAVRKTLENAGIEMRGGDGGPPRSIGFQGRFFQIRN